MNKVKEFREYYSNKGFRRRIGFGERPAVIVIDFTKAFTDQESPIGFDYRTQLQETKKILSAARKALVPVIYTVVEHEPKRKTQRLWVMKQPEGLTDFCIPGTRWAQVDEMLEPRPNEVPAARIGSC